MLKQCISCKEYRSLSDFHKDKTQKDGLCPRCKICTKEYYQKNRSKLIENTRQWQIANSERAKIMRIEWRNNNKEKLREYYRNYRLAHIEKSRQYSRDWKDTNPDRNKQLASQWTKNNPIKNAIRNSRRKARIAGNGGVYTEKEWNDLCTLYNHQCLCCKEQKPLTADHIIPISRGGSNYIENIQPLCQECNSRKGQKIIDYRIIKAN